MEVKGDHQLFDKLILKLDIKTSTGLEQHKGE